MQEVKITMEEMTEKLPAMLQSLKEGTHLGNVVFLNGDTDTLLGVGVADNGSEDIREEASEDEGSSEEESSMQEIVVEDGYEPPNKRARREQDTVRDLARALQRLATKEDVHFATFHDIKALKLRAGDGVFSLATCTLAQLEPLAEPAPFGNLAENRTQTDETVRRALQIKRFSVVSFTPTTPQKKVTTFDRTVLDAVSAAEDSVFYGATDLRLLPHAINVYREGDHFARHVDTQRYPDLLGTVTFVAGDFDGGKLVVRHPTDASTKLSVVANRRNLTGVALRATCPHEVARVTRGLRVSATFDVCGTMSFDDRAGADLMRAVDAVFASHPDCRHLGLVLHHMYTAQDRQRGAYRSAFDQTLVHAAGSRGTLVPLQWTQNRFTPAPSDSDPRRITHNYVSTLSQADAAAYAGALFFSGREDHAGFTAVRDIQIAADHTGNESIEGHDNAIYLVTVLMVARQVAAS